MEEMIMIRRIDFDTLLTKVESIEGTLSKISEHFDKENEALLNQKQAAKMLDVTPKTLYNYTKSGIIEPIWIGNKAYYTRSILKNFNKK